MKNNIQSKLDTAINELHNAKKTLNDIYSDPELILTELYNPSLYQPYYALPFQALDNNGIKHHEFQKELAKLLIGYLRKFDNEVEIKLANQMSVPSKYTIHYLGKELMRFDVYNHSFSDFTFELDKVQESLRGSIKGSKNSIKISKDKIEKHNKVLNNPIKESVKDEIKFLKDKRKNLFKVTKDCFAIVYYVYKDWDTIKQRIDTRLINLKDNIERDNEDIIRYEKAIEENEQLNPFIQEKYEQWKSFFLEKGYTDEGKRSHRLY